MAMLHGRVAEPLALPETARAAAWLGGPGVTAAEGARAAAVVAAAAQQRRDGSWGDAADWRRRVMPTLWMVATLADLGATHNDGWTRAAGFLGSAAATDGGVFSRTGTPEGVLSCYVGIVATAWLLGGRRDLAEPQVRWILRHQDVRHDGASARRLPVEPYHRGLATRYGGCLADTTCLIGVIKAGRALELWLRTAPTRVPATGGDLDHAEVRELLGAFRGALLARSLMHRGDGGILPLGSPTGDPERWLLPSFPLDWRTDLVEVLDLVARTGPADARMQPAVDRLAALQLADGTWPLRRSHWPQQLAPLERCDRRRASHLVTARVVRALDACKAEG